MATESRHQQRPLRTLTFFFAFTIALYAIMAVSNVWTPKLGLDLKGGTTITLTARNTTGTGQVDASSLEQARLIIQQRVDAVGVGESEVTTMGNNQVTVAVPNVAPAQLQEMVGRTAQLHFRPVYTWEQAGFAPAPTINPQPEEVQQTITTSANGRPAPQLPTPVPSPRPTEPAGPALTTQQVMTWQPSAQDLQEFAAYQCGQEFPDVIDQPLITCDRSETAKYLLGPVALGGELLSNATSGIPQGGVGQAVQLQFNQEGSMTFEAVTRALAAKQEPQNQFAIVLDSQVVSAPSVSAAIPGGQAQITGNFTAQTASDLASVLKYGALPLTFDLSEVANVSPTLGGEQLRAGIIAGLIGLALVVVYSLFYYRALSIIVIASLALAAVITYAFMVLLGESMGFALNLPGIAGAIVAIGTTADSFIIYYERIRDHVREGRSLRSAIETGWVGSRQTILIADAVSLLSAVVLFALAIGSVKGFAFTLGLTTLIDIAIVFWFTKPMMTLLGRTKYFGEGGKFSGFEPEHLGSNRPALRRRLTPKEA